MPTKEGLEQLIAAIIATNEGKVDMKGVAGYTGMTYDAVEKKMRPLKEEARKMLGEGMKTPSKPTPRKRKAFAGNQCKHDVESPCKKRRDDSDSLAPPAATGKGVVIMKTE